jgi:hypothetical protein
MPYMLGKKPASPLKKKAIRFSDIFNLAKLPTPPQEFGHSELIKNWGMLGNDEFGCCVWASKAHCHMLWSRMGQHVLDQFTTFNVLSDYAAQTGFSASDPESDQGTDMKEAAEYHRKIGVLDRAKVRRRVSSYINNALGNIEQIAVCAYIFGAVEIGVILSKENMDQFDNEQVWTVTGTPVGGHCVPIVGRDGNGDFIAISWGRTFRMSPAFIQTQMDEGITYLSDQTINRMGKSGGFDRATLDQMLAKISPQIFAVEQPAEESIRYGLMAARQPNKAQYDTAFKLLRKGVDSTGYGFMIADPALRVFSQQIAEGVVAAGDQ